MNINLLRMPARRRAMSGILHKLIGILQNGGAGQSDRWAPYQRSIINN